MTEENKDPIQEIIEDIKKEDVKPVPIPTKTTEEPIVIVTIPKEDKIEIPPLDLSNVGIDVNQVTSMLGEIKSIYNLIKESADTNNDGEVDKGEWKSWGMLFGKTVILWISTYLLIAGFVLILFDEAGWIMFWNSIWKNTLTIGTSGMSAIYRVSKGLREEIANRRIQEAKNNENKAIESLKLERHAWDIERQNLIAGREISLALKDLNLNEIEYTKRVSDSLARLEIKKNELYEIQNQ